MNVKKFKAFLLFFSSKNVFLGKYCVRTKYRLLPFGVLKWFMGRGFYTFFTVIIPFRRIIKNR